MKTKTFLTIILAAVAIASASAQSDKIVKQNRNVSEFTSITASSGWDVIVRQGNRQSVSIEVSEGILDRAVIEVKNGTLHIYNKNNKRIFSWNKARNATQKAYATVTDLKKITASGGVDVRFETPLKTNDFTLSMSGGTDLENLSLNCNRFIGNFSGGSDAEIRFLSAQTVKVDASGGCDVKLSGKTQEFTINASGGSDISAAEFEARKCTARFSGAADGEIRVSDTLDISVSGASDVICYGNPRDVEKSVNKSSSLRMK